MRWFTDPSTGNGLLKPPSGHVPIDYPGMEHDSESQPWPYELTLVTSLEKRRQQLENSLPKATYFNSWDAVDPKPRNLTRVTPGRTRYFRPVSPFVTLANLRREYAKLIVIGGVSDADLVAIADKVSVSTGAELRAPSESNELKSLTGHPVN